MSLLQKILVLFLLGVSSLLSADPGKKDRDQVMLVLDASGSMWGRVQGKAKIKIAQEIIKGLLDSWDSSIDLGLIAYGHRKRGDCSDIEQLAKPGDKTAKQLYPFVSKIVPRGKTPLAASVKKAAETLNYRDSRATVILVSDGRETCSRVDPCEIVKELEASGADFTAHVVGFAVDDVTAKQLECVATETGGLYRGADNAEELLGALKQVVEAVKRAGNDTAFAVLGHGGKPITSAKLSWALYAKNEANVELANSRSSEFELNVPAGEYLVEARIDGERRRANITVDDEQVRRHQVVLGLGLVQAIVRTSGTAQATNIEVLRGEELLKSREATEAEFYLGAGSYVVEAQVGGQKQRKSITVQAQRRNVVNFDFRQAQLKLDARQGGTDDPVDATWTLDRLSSRGAIEESMNLQGADVQRDLAPGKYVIKAQFQELKLKRSVMLRAGDKKRHSFRFAFGRLIGIAPTAKGDVRWVIYEREANGSRGVQVATGEGRRDEFVLPPGKYIVSTQTADGEVTNEIEIRAGEVNTLEVALTGVLKMSAVKSVGSIPQFVEWQVFKLDSLGEPTVQVARAEKAVKEFELPAGVYRVIAIHPVGSTAVNVEVAAGGRVAREIVLGFGDVVLQAYAAEQGEPMFVTWSVYRLDANDRKLEQVLREAKTNVQTTLPQGRYLVEARFDELSREAVITVEPGQRVVRPFYFNSGTLRLAALKAANSDPVFADWSIYKLNKTGQTTAQVAQQNGPVLKKTLGAGTYRVVASYQGQQTEKRIVIRAGEAVARTLHFNFGQLAAVALDVNEQPVQVEWTVYRLNGKLRTEVVRGLQSRQEYLLPAGKYEVVARRIRAEGEVLRRQEIELQPAGQEVVTMVMDTASLRVEALRQDNGVDTQWEVYELQGDKRGKRVLQTIGNVLETQLRAGQYEVVAKNGEASRTDRITLQAGGKLIRTDFLMATVRLEALPSRDEEAVYAQWEIYRLQGGRKAEQVFAGGMSRPQFELPAGSYVAEIIYGDVKGEQRFTLKAGERVRRRIILGIGSARLVVSSYADTTTSGAWRIYRVASATKSTLVYEGQGSEAEISGAAGNYIAELRHPLNTISHRFKIEAGKTKTEQLSLRLAQLRAQAVKAKGGVPVAATWRVEQLRAGAGDRLIAEGSAIEQKIILPEGNYRVAAVYNGRRAVKTVTVKAGSAETIELDFGLGSLTTVLKRSREGQLVSGVWMIHYAGKEIKRFTGARYNAELPAGNYVVHVAAEGRQFKKNVTVKAGEETATAFSLGMAELRLTAVAAKGSNDVLDAVWTVEPIDKKAEGQVKALSANRYVLPAGKYRVFGKALNTEASKVVQVRDGQVMDEEISFGLGGLELAAVYSVKGEPVEVRWQVLQNGKQVSRGTGSSHRYRGKAGEYQIIVRRGARKLERMVTVPEGKMVPQLISLGMAYVQLQASFSKASEPVQVDWKVEPLTHRYAQPLAKPDNRYLVPAGRYRITAKHPFATKSVIVSVADGDDKPVKILLELGQMRLTARRDQGESTDTIWDVKRKVGSKLEKVWQGKARTKFMTLTQGTYHVVARFGGTEQKRVITLAAGEVADEVFEFARGNVVLTAVVGKAKDPVVATWRIVERKNNRLGALVKQTTAARLKENLEPGTYRVQVEYAGMRRETDIRVKSGEQMREDVFFDVAQLKVSAREARNGPAAKANWVIYPLVDGVAGEPVARAKSSSKNFSIAPGKYRVQATYRGVKLDRDLQIGPGAIVQHELFFAGVLEITAYRTKGGQPESMQWRILEADNGKPGKQIASSISASRRFTLSPGNYYVIGNHDARDVKAEVTVKPGHRTEQIFYLDIGKLELRAKDAKGKPVAMKWTILQIEADGSSGGVVAKSIREERHFELPAGRYRVTGKHDSRHVAADVEIVAGKKVEKEFALVFGKLEVNAVRTGKGPLKVNWFVHTEDAANNVGQEVARETGAKATFDLPPGKYRVIMRYKELVGEVSVSVNAAKPAKEEFVLHF